MKDNNESFRKLSPTWYLIFSIERRVNKMEHSIASIISKIDAVLSKMDVITNQENNTEEGTTSEVRFSSNKLFSKYNLSSLSHINHYCDY